MPVLRWAVVGLVLGTIAPLASGVVDLGAEDSETFHVNASLSETVAIEITARPGEISLDSAGSNVNALATLSGEGWGRAEGSLLFAPFEITAGPGPPGPPVGLTWSDGRPADSSDTSLSLVLHCGPGAPGVPLVARVRADGGEVAVATVAGWDRAKVADGRLGDEAADRERAKDVHVGLCQHTFTPTFASPGPSAQVRLGLAILFPWTPEGHQVRVELLGHAPLVAWRSWGPHDFVAGTADDR